MSRDKPHKPRTRAEFENAAYVEGLLYELAALGHVEVTGEEDGWPVFPCKAESKSPLTPQGFKDATTDPAQIRASWSRWPNAMIGTPIVIGLQIDATQSLALVLQPRQLTGCDLQCRQRRRRRRAGERETVLGRCAQLIPDLASLFRAALARVLQSRLGSRPLFALIGDGSLRGTQILRGTPVPAVGGGKLIGGGTALALRRGELGQQFLALLFHHCRDAGQSR